MWIIISIIVIAGMYINIQCWANAAGPQSAKEHIRNNSPLARKLKTHIKEFIELHLKSSYLRKGYYSLPDDFLELLDDFIKNNSDIDLSTKSLYKIASESNEYLLDSIINSGITKSIDILGQEFKTYSKQTFPVEKVKEQLWNWITDYSDNGGMGKSFPDKKYISYSLKFYDNKSEEQPSNNRYHSYKDIINEFIKSTKKEYVIPFETKDEADELRDEINYFIEEQNNLINSDELQVYINEACDEFANEELCNLIGSDNTIDIAKDMLPLPYTVDTYYSKVKPLKFLYRNEIIYKRNLVIWERELFYKKYISNIKNILNYHIELSKVFHKVLTEIEEKLSCNEYEYYIDEDICKYNLNVCIPHVINQFLSRIEFPEYLKFSWNINYDEESKMLLIDLCLPTMEEFPCYKDCKRITKDAKNIELNTFPKGTIKDLYDNTIYSIILNIISSIFSFNISLEETVINEKDKETIYNEGKFLNDYIQNIAVNGIVNYVDDSDGLQKESCILSILTKEQDFARIDLNNVDYIKCFRRLKGISSANLSEYVAITPIIHFNKDDKRFIEGKDVISTLDNSVNLAAMDWKDFENLVRDLFEKEFCTEGAEVKITQSSHDGGVDAVIFDPDPIRGGKFVIQAKRYTNVVNVSAVRDLFGTIHNEGAVKGILVTTSNFGIESYDFAKDKPITLISGNELLHLLAKHNVNAKIDIKEAKKILGLEKPIL